MAQARRGAKYLRGEPAPKPCEANPLPSAVGWRWPARSGPCSGASVAGAARHTSADADGVAPNDTLGE